MSPQGGRNSPGPTGLAARAAGTLAFAFVALASFGAGLFVSDPLAVHERFAEERLWNAGGRRETFPGPSGLRLSVWEIGPLAVERPVVLQHGLGATATYFA